jgi:hypothetical protein
MEPTVDGRSEERSGDGMLHEPFHLLGTHAIVGINGGATQRCRPL